MVFLTACGLDGGNEELLKYEGMFCCFMQFGFISEERLLFFKRIQ